MGQQRPLSAPPPRRGDYRVTLRLDHENRTIIVGRIEHRRDVYRPR